MHKHHRTLQHFILTEGALTVSTPQSNKGVTSCVAWHGKQLSCSCSFVHKQVESSHLGAAHSCHEGNKLGVVVQYQAAQSVLHHEAGHCQQRLHLAEAVGLIVALTQVVPTLACSRTVSYPPQVKCHICYKPTVVSIILFIVSSLPLLLMFYIVNLTALVQLML